MGESRVEDYGYNYNSSSESRSIVSNMVRTVSSESRDYGNISSESHDYDFYSGSTKYDGSKIDELIEELEDNMPKGNRRDKRFNELYEHRKRQIAELKEVAKEARKEAYLSQLEEDNDEIDNLISNIKMGRK